jgi:hypothetical protein
MKLNSNQDVVVEQKVQDRIAATQERLKEVEAAKAKQDAELAALQKELEMLRRGKSSLEQTPAKKNSFISRFFPTKPEEREFTPAFAAPGDVTPEIVAPPAPEPTPAPAPVVFPAPAPVGPTPAPVPFVFPTPAPEPSVPAPVVETTPVPEPVVPGVNFPPEPMSQSESKTEEDDRTPLLPTSQSESKTEEDNTPPLLPTSQSESKTEEDDRVPFLPTVSRSLPKISPPSLPKPPVPEPYQFTPSLESPVKALTATVPSKNRKLPPAPPLSTRRRIPGKKGGLSRKKKLRTRRGGKQKNVGRTRSR